MPNSKTDDSTSPTGSKRRGKGLAILATLGWAVAALLVADRMHATKMNGALHNALVRSQTERHELSQELQRRSDALVALEKRLSRYQSRETQAAVNP